MSDPNPTTRHWAYNLPDAVTETRGLVWWAQETIAEHTNPEYWAWLWGYTNEQISTAKEHAPSIDGHYPPAAFPTASLTIPSGSSAARPSTRTTAARVRSRAVRREERSAMVGGFDGALGHLLSGN